MVQGHRHQKSFLCSDVTKPPRRTTVDHIIARNPRPLMASRNHHRASLLHKYLNSYLLESSIYLSRKCFSLSSRSFSRLEWTPSAWSPPLAIFLAFDDQPLAVEVASTGTEATSLRYVK